MRILAAACVIGSCLGLLSACNDDPVSACGSCDPDAEYCAIYYSDVAGEDPATTCKPLPSLCEEGSTCACLEDAAADDAPLEFCVTEGGCSEVEDVAVVECPGG